MEQELFEAEATAVITSYSIHYTKLYEDSLEGALAAYRQALDGGQHLIEIRVPHDEVANQLNDLKAWIQARITSYNVCYTKLLRK